MNSLQVAKGFQGQQLTLQAFLLIAQARSPVAIGHHQQQHAIAPGGYMTVGAGGRLQLAFKQTLQVLQAFGLVEQ